MGCQGFCFLPFCPFSSVSFRFVFRQKRGDTVRETPFAKPRFFVFCPSWTFPIFPGLPNFGGIFPIGPFPLFSAYQSTSQKAPRHNRCLSPKRVGNAPVWKPPDLASLSFGGLPALEFSWFWPTSSASSFSTPSVLPESFLPLAQAVQAGQPQ